MTDLSWIFQDRRGCSRITAHALLSIILLKKKFILFKMPLLFFTETETILVVKYLTSCIMGVNCNTAVRRVIQLNSFTTHSSRRNRVHCVIDLYFSVHANEIKIIELPKWWRDLYETFKVDSSLPISLCIHALAPPYRPTPICTLLSGNHPPFDRCSRSITVNNIISQDAEHCLGDLAFTTDCCSQTVE